jgi:hypothetical protein
MARRLSLVLARAFSVSVLMVLMAGPAQGVCRPQCQDLNKQGHERGFNRANDMTGERGEHGKHHHYGWAKHELHKKHKHGSHRGHGGHDDPPVAPPPVTPPPVEPPPPPTGPPPCIGC